MKNNIFTRITTILAIILAVFSAPSANAWTNDINVNPEAGYTYKWGRVSVAFDGTIYVARVFAEPGGSFTGWQILKSTDNGITFTQVTKAWGFVGQVVTSFDMIAVGKDSTDFRLIYVRGMLDTVNNIANAYTGRYKINNTFDAMPSLNAEYTGTTRGYESIALASDWRDPNANASPYSVSIVAAKAGSYDSVIVWSDNNMGEELNRRSLFGSPGFIRSVSCAVGSASINIYGRLGIAWADHATSSDEFGNISVMYIYPDDVADVNNGGPHQFSSSNITRRPRIAMSQNNALDDIYTYVVYETEGGSNETNVNIRADNKILSPNAPTFNVGGTLGGPAGKQVNPDVVYNAVTDSFYATYYDEPSNQMRVAAKKDVNSLGVLADMIGNYRDASGTVTEPMPRMDVMASGKLYFVWNEDDMTWFDGQSVWPASVQSISSNLEGMKLYPNPATSNITLTFTATDKDEATLIITDISGKTVQSLPATINTGSNQIPVTLNNLAAGNYIIRISGTHTNTSMMFSVR